jgi:hypothetical protein
MKKIFLALTLLAMTLAANAQFEKGKGYLEGALNSVGASFNGVEEFKFGVEVKAGLFIAECWMLNAHAGYLHHNKSMNRCDLGVGTRYYLQQNGVYAEFNVNGVFEKGHNDIMPGVELGYAFFLNDKITIEPAVYYHQSFSNHKDYSTVGLKIGLGMYF